MAAHVLDRVLGDVVTSPTEPGYFARIRFPGVADPYINGPHETPELATEALVEGMQQCIEGLDASGLAHGGLVESERPN